MYGFYIDETEVTRRQYERCVADGFCPAIDESTCAVFDGEDWAPNRQLPDASRRPEAPRTCVTRYEAAVYCAWVGARLPGEAEWQLAAAGAEGRIFAWGNSFEPTAVRFVGHSPPALDEVYAREEGNTPQGLTHMSGNAYEWVADDACDYAEWPDEHRGPCRRTEGQGVVRGGSFASDGGGVRVSYRRFMDLDARIDTNGFRCAW